jgi:putative intracellular protease/amidase
LYLGGIQQPAGTYGCSTNLATSQFTNDFHFAGLGVLAVASGPTQLPFVGTVVIMR